MIDDAEDVNNSVSHDLIYQHLIRVAQTLSARDKLHLLFATRCAGLTEEILTFAMYGDSEQTAITRWATAKTGTANDAEEWEVDLRTKGEEKHVTADPINAYLILRFHPAIRGRIRWNAYAKSIEINGGPLAGRDDIDGTVSAAQNFISASYGITIARDGIGHMLTLVAKENAYNPLHDYLFGLEWDGKPRIDRLFVDYFGAEDNDHNCRVSRRFALGAVARGLPPEGWCTRDGREMGAKVDSFVILEHRQGHKKTSAWEVLGGEFYCASSIVIGDKDSKMLASASWFIDLPELASFERAEQAQTKAFLTNRRDSYRAPYGRGIAHTVRQCCLVGSTNQEEYLTDETGNRRYWPIKCGMIRFTDLMRDRDQIWAEAVAVYLEELDCDRCQNSIDTVAGQRPRCAMHRWWLDRSEEDVAAGVAKMRAVEMPLAAVIEQWWLSLVEAERGLMYTTADIAARGLRLEADRLVTSRSLQTKIGIAMTELGFKKSQKSVGGARIWVYTANEELKKMPFVPHRTFLEVISGGKRA